MAQQGKVTILGGGGIRTPLLIHGLAAAREELSLTRISLYDIDATRMEQMAGLGREITDLPIHVHRDLRDALAGAEFVLSSLRVGGAAARARDEQIAIAHGLAGQETTGPGGWAMALRTVPVALEHARAIAETAPDAWLINFTNPAGLITQALTSHSKVRTIGICDTPSELFHRISNALGEPAQCDYLGLNHLGWVRRVRVRGEDVTQRLFDDEVVKGLYPGNLFDPALIRGLGLIPSEYLFYYYSQQRARANQQSSGKSRGGEIEQMNRHLFGDLTLSRYKGYLRTRSGSYMQVESAGRAHAQDEDPFAAATGYHRIALSVMRALRHGSAEPIVIDIRNGSSIPDLAEEDIVEVPCMLDARGPRPLSAGPLPESVRGLVLAVKAYERMTIRAAVEGSRELARMALLLYPIVGQWEFARDLTDALIASDPEHLGYLR